MGPNHNTQQSKQRKKQYFFTHSTVFSEFNAFEKTNDKMHKKAQGHIPCVTFFLESHKLYHIITNFIHKILIKLF